METKTTDGGYAFPFVSHGAVADHQVIDGGMSLRDYFAAAALTGMCTDTEAAGDPHKWDHAMLAKAAYLASDAMLAARAAPSQPRSPEGV